MIIQRLDSELASLHSVIFGFDIGKSILPIAMLGLSTALSRFFRDTNPEKWTTEYLVIFFDAISGNAGIATLAIILFYLFEHKSKRSLAVAYNVSTAFLTFHIFTFILDGTRIAMQSPETLWVMLASLPGVYIVYAICRISFSINKFPELLQKSDWRPIQGTHRLPLIPYLAGLGTHAAKTWRSKLAIGLGVIATGFYGLHLNVLITASSSPFIFASLATKYGPSSFGISLGIYIIVFAVGFILTVLARRIYQQSYETVRMNDPREPVLFLRSFSDDQVRLQREPYWWMQRLLTPMSLGRSLEHLIQDEMAMLGPVVAIGKPGDRLPPLGASRAYVSGSDWKDVVQSLAQNAALIVLVPNETEGVTWELSMLRDNGLLRKTVLLFPPLQDAAMRGAWTVVEETLNLSAFTATAGDAILAISFTDTLPVPVAYIATKRTQTAYRLALRRATRAIGHVELKTSKNLPFLRFP